MLICNKCGRVIDENDLGSHTDFMSYIGDAKYYETNKDNCACCGEFEEAEECNVCGEYCIDKDITLGWRYNIGVCKNCMEHYKNKYTRIYNQLHSDDDFIDWLAEKGEITEK